MVLVIARWETSPCEWRLNSKAIFSWLRQRTLKWEIENISKQPGTWLKMGTVTAQTGLRLLFLTELMKGELLSMEMMMSENQSSWSQVHVTAILGTEETFNPKPGGYINWHCRAARSHIWLLRRPIGEREARRHAAAIVGSSAPTLRKS